MLSFANSGVAGGQPGERDPGARIRTTGGTSTHFIQPFKNAFSNRNLGQNMSKMRKFWKKAVESSQCPTSIGFVPRPRVTPAYW